MDAWVIDAPFLCERLACEPLPAVSDDVCEPPLLAARVLRLRTIGTSGNEERIGVAVLEVRPARVVTGRGSDGSNSGVSVS